jgi:hypothetical protein
MIMGRHRTPLKLTEAECQWLSRQRARPCKHGHSRHDARIYRNRNDSLWLDCVQCVRDRVNAYRQRMDSLFAQAR